MIDKARFTTSLPTRCTAGKSLADEEDFDTLLAGSSLGSEQAMAIRDRVHRPRARARAAGPRR